MEVELGLLVIMWIAIVINSSILFTRKQILSGKIEPDQNVSVWKCLFYLAISFSSVYFILYLGFLYDSLLKENKYVIYLFSVISYRIYLIIAIILCLPLFHYIIHSGQVQNTGFWKYYVVDQIFTFVSTIFISLYISFSVYYIITNFGPDILLIGCITIYCSVRIGIYQFNLAYLIYHKLLSKNNNEKKSIYCEEKSDCDSDLEKRANVKIETAPNGYIVSIV